MSGFTKEWIWFDLTPLAAAATLGHHEIVEYLLQQGADPTLRGYPKEKGTMDALEAAKQNLDYETRQGNTNGVKCNNAQRCVDLLTVANLYWDKASYSNPHYSTKARAVFSNTPTNYQLLQGALEFVPDISEYPEKKLQEASLEFLKQSSSLMLMCSVCNERKRKSLFTEQQILMVTDRRSSKCNECVRKERMEKARVARVKQQVSLMMFGANYYDDDDYDYDYEDKYGHEEVTYLRPDVDTEGKDIQWCKDKGFFEVEEGVWSGKWYNKTELMCRCCKESKHTALFSDRERMMQEFGKSPKCRVCARKEPSGHAFWDDDGDDNGEVTFFRPDGDTETKDVQWCLDNGFFEVEKGLWSGNWYYETDLKKRQSLRKHPYAARFSINDMPPPLQSKKDTAAAGSTACLKNNYVLHSEPIEEPKSTSTEKVAAIKSTQSTPLSFTFGKSGSTDSNSDEKKITAPPFSFSLGKASADTMQNEDEKKANIYSFSFGEATVKPSFTVGSNEKKKKATIKTSPVSTSIQSSDEKKITASPFSFSFDKAASADTVMPNKGEKKANMSSFSSGEATAKPSFRMRRRRKLQSKLHQSVH